VVNHHKDGDGDAERNEQGFPSEVCNDDYIRNHPRRAEQAKERDRLLHQFATSILDSYCPHRPSVFTGGLWLMNCICPSEDVIGNTVGGNLRQNPPAVPLPVPIMLDWKNAQR